MDKEKLVLQKVSKKTGVPFEEVKESSQIYSFSEIDKAFEYLFMQGLSKYEDLAEFIDDLTKIPASELEHYENIKHHQVANHDLIVTVEVENEIFFVYLPESSYL